VFSWDHPDAGSRLLLEHLPAGLSGRGMDLGCGNGYLSCHVLSHYGDIREWHAVDVDAVALDCAAQNLQGSNLKVTMGERSVQTHWMDATRESMPKGMDVILLNPPFHRDKADLVSLGQAMIIAAKHSLQQAGSLFLVANRHLPYELLLYENFEQVSTLFDGEGYKVIRCDGVQE
jgi:16S rRNA (guanine1207-N2)-methyltransferase